MIYIHLAEGFEEVEALTAVDVLRRADIEVQMVSMTGSKTVTGVHGISVETDLLYEEADYENCQMIVLPGGLPGATNLEAHEGLAKHIKCFADNNKDLAAICAAPLVLGSCGVLNNKKATIYPGMEEELKGGQPTGENVTIDGNIITGMGPAIAMEFALALVARLKGQAVADEVSDELIFDRR